MKRLYGYKDKDLDPVKKSESKYANNISSISYEEYYRRIKEMGTEEKMKDDEITKYLGDRPLGEKVYKRVSSIILIYHFYFSGSQEKLDH